MKPQDLHITEQSADPKRQFGAAVCLTIFVILAGACSTSASLGDLPYTRAAVTEVCPLGTLKICHVGWPSRLKSKERLRSCRCR